MQVPVLKLQLLLSHGQVDCHLQNSCAITPVTSMAVQAAMFSLKLNVYAALLLTRLHQLQAANCQHQSAISPVLPNLGTTDAFALCPPTPALLVIASASFVLQLAEYL